MKERKKDRIKEEGEATSRKGVHKFDLPGHSYKRTRIHIPILTREIVKAALSRLSKRIKLILREFSTAYLFAHSHSARQKRLRFIKRIFREQLSRRKYNLFSVLMINIFSLN